MPNENNIVSIQQALKQLKDASPAQFYYTNRKGLNFYHQTVNCDYIIALYDNLTIKYPNLITKNIIYNNDYSWSNCEYIITMRNKYKGTFAERYGYDKEPTYLILSGIHGHERMNVLSTYNFICDLLEGNNIPQSFMPTIRVMPVGSPYAFDKFQQINKNGVNINRNFDYNGTWGYGVSGSGPASEKETQVIQKWLMDNRDADLYIDFHNSGSLNEMAAILGDSNNKEIKNLKRIAVQGVNKLVPYLKNIIHYPQYFYADSFEMENGIQRKNVPTLFCHTAQIRIPGTSSLYAQDKCELNTFSLETPSYYGSSDEWEKFDAALKAGTANQYQSEPIALGSEVLGNILIEIYNSVQ